MDPISEHMWCYNCGYEWDTSDYLECNLCPACTLPTRIYRTSSFGYLYAHIEKHPELYPDLNKNKDRKEKIEKIIKKLNK